MGTSLFSLTLHLPFPVRVKVGIAVCQLPANCQIVIHSLSGFSPDAHHVWSGRSPVLGIFPQASLLSGQLLRDRFACFLRACRIPVCFWLRDHQPWTSWWEAKGLGNQDPNSAVGLRLQFLWDTTHSNCTYHSTVLLIVESPFQIFSHISCMIGYNEFKFEEARAAGRMQFLSMYNEELKCRQVVPWLQPEVPIMRL